MTDAAHRELLDVTANLAVLIAGAYVACHLVRYIVILINRGIDDDIHATHRRMGHHRYVDPDAAHDVPRDGLSVEPGQSGIEWLCGRVRERRERRAANDGAHDEAHDGPSTVVATGRPCRPPGPRAARAARTVVVVRGGAFAGARVRVLMESQTEPGTWFVEVVEGNGIKERDGITVLHEEFFQ